MDDKYYTESHKKTIDRYDKDFNNTEKNVHNKADSNSKKAYAFAIPAVVIALLLIAFIGIALTGSVKKAVKKSAITNNYTEISNKIYSYLDSSSYKELSDYSDEIDALDNKAFDKLCRAYIEARYNRLFTVNKEEYEYMLARTEVLREVTIRECAARIAYYDEMIEKEEKDKI